MRNIFLIPNGVGTCGYTAQRQSWWILNYSAIFDGLVSHTLHNLKTLQLLRSRPRVSFFLRRWKTVYSLKMRKRLKIKLHNRIVRTYLPGHFGVLKLYELYCFRGKFLWSKSARKNIICQLFYAYFFIERNIFDKWKTKSVHLYTTILYWCHNVNI